VETRPFDPVEYLDSEEAIAAYLADARKYGGENLSDAIAVVARARAALEGRVDRATSTVRAGGHDS
jgi:DNA-binding phage protein